MVYLSCLWKQLHLKNEHKYKLIKNNYFQISTFTFFITAATKFNVGAISAS